MTATRLMPNTVRSDRVLSEKQIADALQVSKLADMSILAFTRTRKTQLPLGRNLHFVNAWYIYIYINNRCLLN